MKHRVQRSLYLDDCISWDMLTPNPAFQVNNKNDVYVDCGAFVGDTIEKFIWHHEGILKRVIGFEPDIKNFRALEKRAARLRDE